MDTIARLADVRVSLGGRPVLAGLDLTVEPGDCIGVAGPNGSGKTTLARAIATLLPIESGAFSIFETELPTVDLTSIRRQIGLIGHQPALIPELTLTENLEHIAHLSGVDTSRIANALDVVGLAGAGDRRAAASSFGMRRRVEIAHLLLTRPRLLLLDEAASGLDEAARDLIGALLRSVRERGGGAVMVSHDMNHLSEMCETVFKLDSGHLVESS